MSRKDKAHREIERKFLVRDLPDLTTLSAHRNFAGLFREPG